MAKAQRVAFLKCTLADTPGSLLSLASDLKMKKVGLLGLSGSSGQPGNSDVYLIVKDAEKIRNALKASGMQFEEGTGFYLKGEDKTGALVSTLDALAKANVNLTGGCALAASGNYGLFLRVAPADLQRAAQALGVK